MKRKERLTEHQSGNKAPHLTETMNVMMTDKFLEAVNEKMLTLMVLLDLSKAFDSIDHAKLLVKLSLLGMSSSGAICMIARSIYELALKCLEYVDQHMEFQKDPNWGRRASMHYSLTKSWLTATHLVVTDTENLII